MPRATAPRPASGARSEPLRWLAGWGRIVWFGAVLLVLALAADMATWSRIEDPLARLVAAGVLVRRGQGSPALLDAAAQAASQQGWRRPLLAWRGVQLRWAECVGDAVLAQRLRRRIELASGN